MKSNLASVLFVFLITNICFSQNLVLNGSFEETVTCANDLEQFNKNVKFWNVPTSGSSDLFNACADFEDVQASNNYQGNQLPFEGENYAGCYFYGIDDYREYIQGQLSEPLVVGSTYKISFQVSLADNSDMALKDVQILFSDSKIKSWGTFHISSKRIRNKKTKLFQIELSNGDYLNDKESWIELSKEFTATEAASHLTIGNFRSNKQTDIKKQRFIPKIRKAYYYIDHVQLIRIDPPIEIEKPKTVVKEMQLEESTFKLNSIYTLKSVLFDFDKATLIEKTTQELDELVTYLKSHLDLKVTINGHTDYLGNAAYNQKLSEDRAKSVANYLINKGISKHRINYRGYGESQPIDPNEPEDAQAKNRRVEFVLSN
ncbi:OmpA family protein [Nonlabens sp. Asnod2-A12]|uniref:OmpA family protein n=1 Tax=Nonlabens sp. Asnod2-A12 TaxID=3160578 RepID=UPI00386F4508